MVATSSIKLAIKRKQKILGKGALREQCQSKGGIKVGRFYLLLTIDLGTGEYLHPEIPLQTVILISP